MVVFSPLDLNSASHVLPKSFASSFCLQGEWCSLVTSVGQVPASFPYRKVPFPFPVPLHLSGDFVILGVAYSVSSLSGCGYPVVLTS